MDSIKKISKEIEISGKTVRKYLHMVEFNYAKYFSPLVLGLLAFALNRHHSGC